MDKAIYINDLINRFPGFQFSEISNGDLVTVAFLNVSEVNISSSLSMNFLDAYRSIRDDVLNGERLNFLSTSDQRDALINPDTGLIIFNITEKRNEIYNGTEWVGAGGEMGGIVHFKPAMINTTDNTPTVIKSLALDEEFAYLVTAEILGETAGHEDVAGFTLQCTVKRKTGGAAELVGSVATVYSGKDTGASSWDATFEVSGNNLNIVVQGQVSDTIAWEADTNYLKF